MVSSLLVFFWGEGGTKENKLPSKGEQNKTKGMSLIRPESKGGNFSLISHNSYN
jgi:hypothetical protein